MRRHLGRFGKYLSPLFLLTVIIPTLGALLYFGMFASDIYISESKFVVRAPDKPETSGFGMLLNGAGFANANDEVHAAQDFITSRDALRAINTQQRFLRSYTDAKISAFDRFNGLGFGGTFEDLYDYFQKKVKVEEDSNTSITTLTVRAYNPRDAHRFNQQLLEMAETTVNRLNARGHSDLVGFAQVEVDNAKRRSMQASTSLAAYRNRAGIVDPERQATAQLQMVSKLQDELIANRIQLAEVRRYAPQNPQIDSLETRIASLQRQINEENGKVAGNRGSLAAEAAQYQRLALEVQFADKQLGAAMASLQEAQNESRRKQAYVERIVQPNLPDDALEPRRLRGIFVTLILGLVAYGILSMLLAGVREHRD